MLHERAGKLDLCTIPTSIHTHAALTIAALEAGANVLVEKPAAATLGEIDAMRAAETAAGRFVAVGFQALYDPVTLYIKQALLDGAIGDIQSMSCMGMWPRSDAYYARDWVGTLKLGEAWVLDSPFNNAMAHQVNLMCFLAGTELGESANLKSTEANLMRARDIETTDTVALRIITSTGVPIHFFATHCSHESVDPEFVIRGRKGTIHWTLANVRLQRRGHGAEVFECLKGPPLRDALMDAVLERTAGHDQFVCGLDIAAVHTLCVAGAHLSATVHPFPKDLISRTPAGESFNTVINGIDGVIRQAFEQERLFSEMDLPWAVPGTAVSLEQPGTITEAYR